MTQRDEVQKFEQGRIRFLQEERLHIQKKTFTKWMNCFLQKARMEVNDLFVDLADGKKLLKLLEIISGEKLGKPNNGKMRVHKIENVNKSLAFLHTKVRLESIGAEDIVDGNPRLILGLVWTIILRFQIQEIEIDVDEDNESSEKKSAKDALLLWAQRKTHGYPGVNINDFSSSWRSGLGFNALIHNHRPDLFDFNSLVHNKNIDNLNHAFDVANNELGIPRLLDAEDIDTSRPDEKSIMTYVASYYHTFARMKNEEKSGRRIAKIVSQMVVSDKNKIRYEKMTTDLLEWIREKITELDHREFPNSLDGIQTLLLAFGKYRTIEKPPKYKERSEIEALYFNINTQLKELRQPSYTPPDGKLVQDIEKAWETLETAEHNLEVALRTELRRQERLEQLCFKFERKALLREGYLKEMIQVLSEPRYGSNLAQVDATNKKHEAIIADIMSRENRVHDLTQMCDELVKENYRDSQKVIAKHETVNEQWSALLALLEKHKKNLNRMGQVMSLLREIDTTMSDMQQLNSDLSTLDTGVHLIAVEELLQKHALQELQLNSFGESVKKLQRTSEQVHIVEQSKEKELVKSKMESLNAAYKELQEVSAHRKAILDEARNFYQFLQDQGDAEAWIVEKQRICQAGITAKDLRAVLALQQKHKVLIDEIKARKNKIDQLSSTGKQLLIEKHPRSPEIQQHIDRMNQEWLVLEELAETRSKQLQNAVETYQFYADANEADSWLNEKISLVTSSDFGTDEPSAQALLSRHKDLEGEINAYSGDVQSLNTQASRLIASGISHLDLTTMAEPQPEEPVEETVYETRMVPMEVYEDEPVEKIEYRTVLEERKVPQVRALYPFNDHGLTMVKGEVMFLLNKSNPDWWCVRKADGSDGFAPANYVAEIEPRIIQIPLKKAETVKSIQRVKKTKMVSQKVPVKVLRQKKQSSKPKMDDSVSVPLRQTRINETYENLKKKAVERHALLEDAVRLFKFYKECDDFERWMKDKEKYLREEPDGNVEQAKRKYEKFVTDLSASNNRMEELNQSVRDFENMNHSQIDNVKSLHRHVQAAWRRLNQLKTQKERNLAGASSVELFQKLCEEAKDWMSEKMEQLKIDILGHDLKTVQALQRKHDNLERELNPLEEKVNKVVLLANSVKSAYPNEKQNVMEKQKEIEDLWQKVKDKALERRARLEDAVGLQIFDNSCKDLLGWVSDIKNEINAENTVRDVQTAENLIKHHKDMEKEILSKNDEFQQLSKLGKKLAVSNESREEILGKVKRLEEEQAALQRGWREKLNWIEQCLQLQNFNKEADNIDASTSAHMNFLDNSEVGNSLDEVEALQKQHRAFANTFFAQDERINAFNKRADSLIADQHYESAAIDEKRNQVLARRAIVKERCQQRWKKLEACKNYQEFCAEVDDLRVWMADKSKTASDESYRDLANLERKLQKHEAFERELRANEGQLRNVNNLGQALISDNSAWKTDVAKTLNDLNNEWQHLVRLSLDKGRRLRQAVNQHAYNSSVDDVKLKLDEIEEQLNGQNFGNDLRSCKDLLRRHDDLVTELGQCANRVEDLAKLSSEMNDDGHFDSDTIGNNAISLQKRLYELDKPARLRKAKLEKALQYYKFWFDLDTQLQWIKDHVPLATSEALGQNLHQAQNLYKKHKKLEAEILGHQPDIYKTLEIGEELIKDEHPEKVQIKNLSNELINQWNDLNESVKERARQLELSLKAQQFFFEVNEVESWLNEKGDILASTDFGRDRDSATKLLTKHKVLQLELETYKNIIAEMGRGVQELSKMNHPELKTITERQSSIEHLVRSLQRKAEQRQHRLMESLFRHEYFLESSELEDWILENLQQASSEDYGQDYEHLLLLRNKFDDFKLRIEAGAERFRQCEALAQKLIANQSSYIAEINSKQEQLDTEQVYSETYNEVMERHELVRKSWEKLHEQINNREVRLLAAGEVHRFHRDVADALQRIHEKNAALGTELGRDLNSAQALLRKHEKFENELVALEAQLQLLVEDASRLQKIYPSNKANIQSKQEIVVAAWNKLKSKDDLRRDQLQASVDLQQFLKQVRDLTNWAIDMRLSISAEENARSIARAQIMKSEHDALKSEIEAREKMFHEVADNLAAMEQTGHYSAAEAVEKYKNLIEERQKLHNAWQLKKLYLDQLYDLHLFFREAKIIEDATNSQEAALGSLDLGDTFEEVSNHLKKHEEFEKVIYHQDEKLDILNQSGRKLINQNHFDAPSIAAKLEEIQNKRRKVHQLCLERKIILDNALLYAEFNRDVCEMQIWITEKLKKLAATAPNVGIDNNLLENKIKMLQKHQAFQAEVTANKIRIVEIKQKGEKLLNLKHSASEDVKAKLRDLEDSWNALIDEVKIRGKGLEEAQDILEFNNELDKIETWIRDKELMIQAGETGKDYEHCQALQRKLDDVDSDMRIDDSKLKQIYNLADKLERQGHEGVQKRKENFIKKWSSLQGALVDYRNKLSGAAEIHLFNRDVHDTIDRIDEKFKTLQSDDVGRDLITVQALQRKLEALEAEIKAVETKLEEHKTSGAHLTKKYPECVEEIQEKLAVLHEHWNNLAQAKIKRKEALNVSLELQKFLTEVKELELWVDDIIKRMEARPKPENIAEAEMQIEFHNELKAEINGRNETFNRLIEAGSRSHNPEIKQQMEPLKELQEKLFNSWNLHKREITYDYDLQDFKDQTNQINNWFATKEAFLNNDDVGDTPSAVEALIKKHQNFTKMLEAQLNRIDELEQTSHKLSNPEVSKRMAGILNRKNRLLASTEARKIILDQSKALQSFLKNVCSVEIWLNQKLQVASDENYREPHNLQSKIQKHSTFEAEITANNVRIQSVLDEGSELIHNDHYAKTEIATKLEEIEEDWKRLLELTKIKREKLNEAYQALLFIRSIEEFEAWLSEIDAQVKSTEFGNDLATVSNLLKRHLALENDYQQHLENCETINEMAEQFSKSDNFMKDEIEERAQSAITKFHQLKGPIQDKKDMAESCLMLHQFSSEIDEELQWLNDREPIAASLDLGTSLTAVQSLQKKHQILEIELNSREHVMKNLVERATNMTRAGHEFSADINAKIEELKKKFALIRDLASIRRLRLQDALEAQTFYEESMEAEAWIHDRHLALSTSEVGRDEITTQLLQRKLEIIAAEVKSYQETVEKLNEKHAKLSEREHYDSANIKQRANQISQDFQRLRQLLTQREVSLSEALQYFGFVQECTEFQEWIKDQISKADSEEYGVDVEHVELLIQAFDTFHTSVMNSEARLQSCLVSGNALIEAKCTYSAKIQEKMTEVQTQWEDLIELVHVRKEALAGAKQVHVFDRTAEEIISWIQEKEADLSYDTYGHDLESIQDLIRKHAGFENELKVIRGKVDQIEKEADRLIEEFPDTKEHVDDKREDTLKSYDYLVTCAERRKLNLEQAERSQVYIDQYQELLAWISEMLARVTAPTLPQEVLEAELLVEKHRELKVEIDAKSRELAQFYKTGQDYITENHFMSKDIEEKLKTLKIRADLLHQTWQNRKLIYEQNLDAQLFKREAAVLENWLITRENTLRDEKLGDNILQVEELLRKHYDFEEAVKAQEEKFAALQRKTMIEEAFALQLKEEERARKAEKERREQEKLEIRKRQEMQRLTESRRMDEGVGVSAPPMINVNGVEISPEKPQTAMLRKTNSVAHLFDHRERLRKLGDGSIKRAESMKTDKPIKRTPSFTTKRKGSFRARTGNDAALPPVEAEGFVERKQILSPNGKRATNRGWKNSYTVLCGQLMCFFKNKEYFAASKANCPPINIHNAKCTIADDYQKRRNTFRLQVNDGSEFLFSTNTENDMLDWINKIVFRARLPPSQQLLNFDIVKDNNEFEMSSQSSRTSSPEVTEPIVELRNPNVQNNNGSSNNNQRHSLDDFNTALTRQEWNNNPTSNRPNTLSGGEPPKSHRIWDLLLKKKNRNSTSQM